MSRLVKLDFYQLTIPFRQRFSHAAASRVATQSVWVEAVTAAGARGVGEGCPRAYVTGETPDTARMFFAGVRASVLADIHDPASLRAWVATHAGVIDCHPAAWCAIELAVIDALAREAVLSAEDWLGLAPTIATYQYSAVLGDADAQTFAATYARYRTAGFDDYKLKLSGDLARDRAKLAQLREPAVARLRLDANNLWDAADPAITWLRALAAPAFAVEEPLAVARGHELPRLARETGLAVILDESLTRIAQLHTLDARTDWIVNLRVSKLGGLLRTLALIEAARARGLKLIVGAQVGETSLLTRVALVAARAAGEALIAHEGAFGTQLLEADACVPCLMFGAGGRLAFSTGGAGWGLDCRPQAAWLDD